MSMESLSRDQLPFKNLQEYVQNRMYHQEAGWVNGKVYFRGKFFTQQEFDELFPCILKYKVVQLDGRQMPK